MISNESQLSGPPGATSLDAHRDPLAPFREDAIDVQEDAVSSEELFYEAFSVRAARGFRFKLCPTTELVVWFTYSHLQEIQERSLVGEVLLSFSSGVVVLISGARLAPLAEALASETCEAVRAFDATRWQTAVSDSSSFVSNIKIGRLHATVDSHSPGGAAL